MQRNAIQTSFSDRQKSALLKLLADDDPAVYQEIRAKIVASGPAAAEWLRPHLLSPDPVLRARARSIVRQFDRHAADNEFVVFCLNSGQDLDLEKGVLLLSRTAYPETNLEAYSALLDDYARTLRERIEQSSGPAETLKRIRQFLFRDLGFSGNEENYYDPRNSYFSQVIDRRTGNPISLCTVYLLLARRLQLPVAGVGLPGHFICRYQGSSMETYIDPFHGGKLMTKADCIHYLLRSAHEVNDEHLAPVPTRRMLLRMCGNLHQIYTQNQETEEATRLRRYLVALTK